MINKLISQVFLEMFMGPYSLNLSLDEPLYLIIIAFRETPMDLCGVLRYKARIRGS